MEAALVGGLARADGFRAGVAQLLANGVAGNEDVVGRRAINVVNLAGAPVLHVESVHQQGYTPLELRTADPNFKYSAGTTNMLSNVDVARPQRITIAIGV